MFSSKSLLFLDLACESLIHFKLLFVKYVRVKSIILHVPIQFLKHHLFKKKKKTILSPLNVIDTILKLLLPYMQGFTSGLSIALVFMSFFMPVSHHFDYCSFVVSFEIRKFKSYNFLFQD